MCEPNIVSLGYMVMEQGQVTHRSGILPLTPQRSVLIDLCCLNLIFLDFSVLKWK